MHDRGEITCRYHAILAQIDRYPVTDPAMPVWVLAEVEVAYRRDRERKGWLNVPLVPPKESET